MKTCSKTKTLRPLTGEHWCLNPNPALDPRMDRAHTRAWVHRHRPLVVLSAMEMAEAPDGDDVIPQWHLSITARSQDNEGRWSVPARPSADDLGHFVDTFGLTEWEIDNHHPGAAQHFWVPRDPARRVDCQCKADEAIVVEPDGYTWTTPVDGPCRGCEHARTTGRPCPLHPEGPA
ncbi:MAG: hypothetical protein ACRCW4_00430 [Candidatus Neomicrothrix subdominans]